MSPSPSPGPRSTVQFTSATYETQENGGQVVLTLNRSGDITGEAQVNYATSDGSAQAGSDYQAKSGEVTFLAQSSSATITIPIVNDDAPEDTEQFTVTLTGTGSAGIGSQGTANVDILDGPAQLLNISTRAQVLTGDNLVIGGFIITGQQNKRVLLLAKGPSLAVGGTPVAGRISDPTLELRDDNRDLLRANNNWKDSAERTQIEQSGLAPNRRPRVGDPRYSCPRRLHRAHGRSEQRHWNRTDRSL